MCVNPLVPRQFFFGILTWKLEELCPGRVSTCDLKDFLIQQIFTYLWPKNDLVVQDRMGSRAYSMPKYRLSYLWEPWGWIWLKFSTQVQTNGDWVLAYFFGGTTDSAGGTAVKMRIQAVKIQHKCILLAVLSLDWTENIPVHSTWYLWEFSSFFLAVPPPPPVKSPPKLLSKWKKKPVKST